ncbi:serine hydrolase [Streptomyces chiangmaiensis]|uniref:Serine hydrolase n=1 Tax=Streptomyces chiangmaiensis TaxID=766497 RepID=A0ABU7FDN0_9ACTN|nr:serine hydrolase [Streptomyces chiangmaiensis]MED7822272.1 serine hydrolase [Streptomyces chiangmaiensis]
MERPGEPGGPGRGPLSRRRFGAGVLTLGGALVVAPLGSGSAAADDAGRATTVQPGPAAVRGTTLRRGSATQAGLLPEHVDEVTAVAERYLGPSPRHPYWSSAVVLAGRGGTVALDRAVGKAVRYRDYDPATDTGIEFPPDQQIDATPDTVYDLASLSKLFTSLVAVQLIERGRIELEAPAARYVPEFAGGGKQDITIRQLLTHTSGLQADIDFYKLGTRQEMLQALWDEKPINKPGTVYLYSDLSMISLQQVLERVTGKPLDRLVAEGITGPLGMTATRYNPPASWQPRIAATEVARLPWSGLDRGLVWGEVHDENAYAFDGVAGHAGVFSRAWDMAVLARTLLNGGVYGGVRILRKESVELMFSDFNTAFPGDDHGLGFELYQHWYMGAMATPRTGGHTGFTGTSIVLDPTTDSFLVIMGNSVHPVRAWRSGSAPRVAAGDRFARAVPVRPAHGDEAWFGGMASASTATLTLPALNTSAGARLACDLWWDTEPGFDALHAETSSDGGATWQPLPFTTRAPGGAGPVAHDDGAVSGYNGRVWHTLDAALPAGPSLLVRWRYTTDRLYAGRGVYVGALKVLSGPAVLYSDVRPGDKSRVHAVGWTRERD